MAVAAAGDLNDGVKTSFCADDAIKGDVHASFDKLGADAKDGPSTIANVMVKRSSHSVNDTQTVSWTHVRRKEIPVVGFAETIENLSSFSFGIYNDKSAFPQAEPRQGEIGNLLASEFRRCLVNQYGSTEESLVRIGNGNKVRCGRKM